MRVDKWAKQVQVQRKSNMFDSFDPILIRGFLSTLEVACDSNGINQDATMWLQPFSGGKPAAVALNSHIEPSSK